MLEDALAFVEKRCPGVAASALLAEGHPAWVLAEQSHHAALVVVGSRHLGGARELFSSAAVSLPLRARSACPVVVLREDEHITRNVGPRVPEPGTRTLFVGARAAVRSRSVDRPPR